MNLHLQQFNKIIISPLVFVGCVGLLTSCEGRKGEGELKDARSASTATESLDLYKKVIQVYKQDSIAMKAALEASSMCLKEKTCADREEFFLKYIIEKSDKEADQIAAQKRLSEIYYDKGFYPQAIDEMNRLLSKANFKDGRAEIKIKLAKSNFYIKNFYQAEVELNSYIKEVKDNHEKFEGYLLKADIQSANKKYTDAMNTYKEIKESFKDLYFRNQVFMNEVLLLEEQKLLDQAVSILESVRSEIENPEALDAKIERLKERKALMPGASGLKR
ncbi:MAG: hypothetical protein V4596_04595 [Bdellovibrionota bacterium]